MRYQVVVLDQEIGCDFDISEISVQVHPTADESAEFLNMNIYMGLCSEDDLGSVFDDNYIPGTRTLVYQKSSQVMSGIADEWENVVLDTPYFYDPLQGNLVIEITWESCVDGKSFYVRGWDTGAIRSVGYTQAGAPSNPSGSLSSAMARLKLTGTSSGDLTSITFGSAKSSFK